MGGYISSYRIAQLRVIRMPKTTVVDAQCGFWEVWEMHKQFLIDEIFICVLLSFYIWIPNKVKVVFIDWKRDGWFIDPSHVEIEYRCLHEIRIVWELIKT